MSTTAKTDQQATKVVIGPVRLSYAHLFEPSAVGDDGDKKYSVSAIIPKSNKELIAQIEKAIKAAKELGKAKWGGKIPAKLKEPLRDGDEDRPDDDAYADSYFVNCSAKTKPGVVDKNRKPVLDQEEVYSGCYGYVSVNFYPFDAKGNKGVAAGLNNVMKTKDGEPLGGRLSAEEDFAELVVEDDEDLVG